MPHAPPGLYDGGVTPESPRKPRKLELKIDTGVRDGTGQRLLRPAEEQQPVHPPSPGRAALAWGRRFPAASLRRVLLVGILASFVGLVFVAYRLGAERGSQTHVSVNDTSSQPSTRVMLLDPVCRRAVDPANAPYILEFGGKSIYFDSLECLNAFRSDPIKYGAGRIRVKLTAQTERDPANLDASSPPRAPGAETDKDKTELAPGGPPEPPGTDAPPTDAPTKGTSNPPMTQAPEAAPPDQGPQPKPQSVSDAPPVTETYPSQPPTDLPQTAPSVPDWGPDATAPSDKKAAGKFTKHKTPVSATRPPTLPRTAPSHGTPDANGFSLPPSLSEGPPSRNGRPVGKSKSAASQKRAVPDPSDGPPSVNE